jgi:predicted branched-subunit amino acid permease
MTMSDMQFDVPDIRDQKRRSLMRGARDTIPMLIGAAPFGMILAH